MVIHHSFLGRRDKTSSHPRSGTDNRPDNEDTSKVQPGESMSFIGVTFRNVGEGLLKRVQMTQRQLHHPMPTPA